jgi:SAM-dependent methyltransferase
MLDDVRRALWVAWRKPRKLVRKIRKRAARAIPRRFDRPYYHDPARGVLGHSHAANRLVALQDVLADAADRTVLDLGCAEGLMAEKFLQAGARHVTAFDVKPSRIATARRLMSTPRARFDVADLGDWNAFERAHALLDGYDIVLFLGIYQHLPKASRAATLRGAAGKTRHRLAVRAPAEMFAEIDVILRRAGLAMVSEKRGHGLGVSRFRLYERAEIPEATPCEIGEDGPVDALPRVREAIAGG